MTMKKTIIRISCFYLAVMAGMVCLPLSAENRDEEKVKAYVVSNAHLDTQWNWDVVTTIDEYVKNTLDQNLFLLNMYPEYVFNFEGGIKYSWMKEYYPERYGELKERIKEGRWHISGSSWDATDALVPSVESAIRNILLGQTFYREEFGAEGTDIFLPDCFGFGWTLPTIAAHCGLIGFSSQKLDWRYSPFYGDKKYPFPIGLWEGVDGSRIMFAHGYNYVSKWNDEDLSESSYLKDLAAKSVLNKTFHYYGTGDIGGSPTLESVRAVEKGCSGNGPVEIISAASDQIFKDYLPFEKHPELPVFSGELLMDVHGTGCYTSQAAMKLYNRQNENLGDAAERAAVAAEWLGTKPYPGKDLTDSWRRFIWHQFHDDLTGTSIPKAYEYSWNDELISLKKFSDILTSSVDGVASKMDTRVKGIPAIIYNQNGFPVHGIVEIIVDDVWKGYSVYDQYGKKTNVQVLTGDAGKVKLLVEAKLPANSYAVYDIRKGNAAVAPSISDRTEVLENSVYKITFDINGDISSIWDKRYSREIVKEGKSVRLALIADNKSYSWPAWEISKETIDRESSPITEDVKISLVENGKLRKTVCIEKRYGESSFRQFVRLYEGPYADRIEFDNEVDWHSTNTLLKAEFPMSVTNPEATYDLGIGTVKRGNNTATAYEVYAQEWADLTDIDGSYGISIMNDSKYGWDKPDDNTLRLTLLHTPQTGGGYPYQSEQDFGHHIFSYSITGHSGQQDLASASEIASSYNRPLLSFISEEHDGELGREFSFVSSDNRNVMIKAVKKAEVTDEYVVRVYETGGTSSQKAKIRFAGRIIDAYEADGTEKTIGKADFDGNCLNVDINRSGIRTYKVVLEKCAQEKAEYRYADLPFDKKCFSWNEFMHEADFSSGYSYSAELLPDSVLVSNGIPFRLGDKSVRNGMSCKGGKISVPAGFNRLYMLAASSDSDHEVTFLSGGKEQTVVVPYYSDFIGQWGHDGHTEGFLKDADIAYIGTHRHSGAGDCAYEFTYMFRIALDIPEGATEVILPEMPGVVIFAATFADEKYASIKPACKMFETSIDKTGSEVNLSGINLMSNAVVMTFSGEVNDNERAEYMIDGNPATKWCDTSGSPAYVSFDLGEEKVFSKWVLTNAGCESAGYITEDCYLQGRNSEKEDWITIDRIVGNRRNVVSRLISPATYRYVRLLVTRAGQNPMESATRIYELEIY